MSLEVGAEFSGFLGLISPSLGTSPLLLSELGCNSRLDAALCLYL